MTDISFLLNDDLKNESYLRPGDFHKMQWWYKFHLKDVEFEEDKIEECTHEDEPSFKEKHLDESESNYPEMSNKGSSDYNEFENSSLE